MDEPLTQVLYHCNRQLWLEKAAFKGQVAGDKVVGELRDDFSLLDRGVKRCLLRIFAIYNALNSLVLCYKVPPLLIQAVPVELHKDN